MTDTVYYPYLGVGKVYARIAGAAAGLMDIGDASKLDLAVKEDKKKQMDSGKLGGGVRATVSRISEVTLSMTLNDLNKTNVARAVFGAEAAVAGATVADEVVTAYLGAIVPLVHINPTAVTVTSSDAVTTYSGVTDYEVRPGGIYILPTGTIADGAGLKVDYTYAAYNKVEAMTTGAIVLELHFEGLNEANSGKPVIVDIYRAQLSPTKALSLLGDKFADLTVDAEVLIDTSKVGVGISQYFRAKMG
ncbi:MAG: hypothetical protein A2503_10180 [Burkholderiales bacterium RIFOXYD12_FULL_59_19]|nr:MAG: hypothetical protein A2503_10180 [Burkholderiales bacterium RIFOXYD12_FULL_59_19]